MRLSNNIIEIIKKTTINYFGDKSRVYLFGSRVDDQKRGGDIDIYIENYFQESNVFEKKIGYIVSLKKKIGDRKIDVIVNNLSEPQNLPVFEIAKKEGILL